MPRRKNGLKGIYTCPYCGHKSKGIWEHQIHTAPHMDELAREVAREKLTSQPSEASNQK